jgi:hypothetical protein
VDRGQFCDEEAFKKSFTDAMTNALKLIEFGRRRAHGLFDDASSASANEFARSRTTAAPAAAHIIADCKAKMRVLRRWRLALRAWWDEARRQLAAIWA